MERQCSEGNSNIVVDRSASMMTQTVHEHCQTRPPADLDGAVYTALPGLENLGLLRLVRKEGVDTRPTNSSRQAPSYWLKSPSETAGPGL